MSFVFRSVAPTLSVMATFGAFFACAGTDEPPKKAAPSPPESSSLLDGSVVPDSGVDAAPTLPANCSASGFCYVSVPPLGPLIAVSASSIDDAWMIAEESQVLLRWDGTSLGQAYRYEGAIPPRITFTSVWAEKKDHLWAAARGSDGFVVVVRYATPAGGGAPTFRDLRTQEPAESISAIWGTPEGNAIWLATDRGVIRIHEGASDAVVDDHGPAAGAEDTYVWRSIWGFGPDDVYIGGKSCSTSACTDDTRGAIGHYDGATWLVTLLDEAVADVVALRGTPAGVDRGLWYVTSETISETQVTKSYLVPVASDGTLGAARFVHSTEHAPACSARSGQATGANSGWFSDALLLCRWTGTEFEPTPTALGGVAVMHEVNGIWASAADDAWVVGSAVTRDDLPKRGFAAMRTTTAAK